MTGDAWDDGELEAQARTVVQGVLSLAGSDEARRILGIDGTLEDEVDLAFVADPLAWIASEIANALAQAAGQEENDDASNASDDEPAGSVSLSTIVALVRLYSVLRGGPLEETELTASVIEYLSEQ